ncbi:PilZ domain-containing protein [Deltaproteobacteria bacterium]|nr:PilZ domain-containing protein [Deltaproteobacteria bacterium]
MQYHDKITGKKIFKTLDQLRQDRTVIKLNILGMDYEGLTIVVGINNGDYSFMIDYPGGSKDAIRNALGKRAVFEFNDRKRILYRFIAVVGEAEKDEVLIAFPKSIERIQRRQHFRIVTPPATRIVLGADTGHELNVINISEAGLLISLKKKFHDKKLFYTGRDLNYFYIVCDKNDLKTRIMIEKASITRIEKKAETGRCNYAIKFLNVGKKSQQDIRDFIYMSQRRELKRRSFGEK